MGPVKVRGTVSASGIVWIIAVKKQAGSEAAAFVEGVRIRVGGVDHQPVGHALVHLQLQSVIGRYALGLPKVGVRIETDVRSAQRGISVGVGKLRNRRLHLFDDQRIEIRVGSLEAIGVRLAMDRIGGRGDARLVERNRNGFVNAVVSDVSQSDHKIVFRLPLEIEAPVFRVGQFVGGIVTSEQKRERVVRSGGGTGGRYGLRASAQLRKVVDQAGDAGQRGWRRGQRSRAERRGGQAS